MAPETIRLRVDRSSVCAGDDCDPHFAFLVVTSETTFTKLLEAAQRVCPLASISGGKATWIINTGIENKGHVGVIAQQWEEPKLLIAPTTAAADIWKNSEGSLYFDYWCQSDPLAVFEAVKMGTELPARYS